MVVRGQALMQQHKKTGSTVSVGGLRQELVFPLLDFKKFCKYNPKTQKIRELWETNLHLQSFRTRACLDTGTANPLPTSPHSLPGANGVVLLKQEQTQGFNIPDILPKRLEVILSTLLEKGALPTPLHGRRGDSDKAWRDLLWLRECSLSLPWASCADLERASSRQWGLVHLQQW